MLSLDAAMVLVGIAMIAAEKWPVVLSQAPVLLLIPCGATYLGAVLASRAASRKHRVPSEQV
jgi:hypothetical protein